MRSITITNCRDSIQSLSPEQQRFAKAFRAMQLESTLFGVLVIQIKPQMETLLRLPPGALTKEIQLTQDLMQLFIEYQVPSDLLTFDGHEDASLEDKLLAVKGSVTNLQATIQMQKKQELDEQRQVLKCAFSSHFVHVLADSDILLLLTSFADPTLSVDVY
ncbi:unnamed protein product [Choristocarpus tenellus]